MAEPRAPLADPALSIETPERVELSLDVLLAALGLGLCAALAIWTASLAFSAMGLVLFGLCATAALRRRR